MTANVLDLGAYRAARESSAACECGSRWFTLVGRSSAPEGAVAGSVALSTDGQVTAYAGHPHCSACGAPWAPGGTGGDLPAQT